MAVKVAPLVLPVALLIGTPLLAQHLPGSSKAALRKENPPAAKNSDPDEAPMRPKIRMLRTQPVVHDGELLIVISDPIGISPEQLAFTRVGAFLLSLMDGTRTVDEIAGEASKVIGTKVDTRQVETLIAELEKNLFLEGAHFATQYAALMKKWESTTVREPIIAGWGYPGKEGSARLFLDGFVHRFHGDAFQVGSKPAKVRALIAPHIDIERGAEAYVAAYGFLAESFPDPDLVVILGTAHTPMDYPISILDKDYLTPLGTVKKSKKAIALLRKRLGNEPFKAGFQQRGEHSVEFQALWLAYVYGKDRPLRIVPVTVGDLSEFLQKNREPAEDARYKKIIGALQEVLQLGKRPLLIAGVDLAHLGVRFGETAFTQQQLDPLEQRDTEFLQFVLASDEKGIFDNVHGDMDGRNYCGFPSLYLAAGILGKTQGRLLKYGTDLSDDSVVSFAAAAVW